MSGEFLAAKALAVGRCLVLVAAVVAVLEMAQSFRPGLGNNCCLGQAVMAGLGRPPVPGAAGGFHLEN